MSFKFIATSCAFTAIFAVEPYYLRPDFIWHQRILDTISCHDCDYIPKVPGAGQFFNENGIDYQLMHNGLKIVKNCYCGEWIAYIIEKLHGHHEPQEEKAFYEVLNTIPSNAIMIELGSFWAYYSMWFQKAIPGAINYMVEPGKGTLETGKKNFALNNMTGTFIWGFIANKTTTPEVLEREGFPYTPIFTVDELVDTYRIPFIWMLHSDIQGYEYQMLLGCQKTLAQKKVGYLFISTHSDEKTHFQCKKFLLEQGFLIIAEHTSAESVSEDGLLVARAPFVTGPTKIDVSRKMRNRSLPVDIDTQQR